METATLIVIVILILALIFFGFTIMQSNNSGRTTGSYSAPSYSGGACGR